MSKGFPTIRNPSSVRPLPPDSTPFANPAPLLPSWLFPPNWNADDWKAFVINMLAAIAVIVVADFVLRGVLGLVGGTSPRLRLHAAPSENLRDVDWPHIRVTNTGLPLFFEREPRLA